MKDKIGTYLIGCEFVYCRNKAETPYRRFVHSVEDYIVKYNGCFCSILLKGILEGEEG